MLILNSLVYGEAYNINEYSTKYYSPESSYISILKEIDKGLSKV